MRLFEVISHHLLFEISDKVKDQMREKYREENDNLTDAQIDYYLDRWDRFSQSFPPNKRDLTKLKFQELEQLIDAAEGKSMLKGRAKQQYDFDSGDDLLYNQNNLVIYRGDMREKCIRYGDGYRWCISRKDASNFFYRYRFYPHEPTFYFVFDKDMPTSDPYHASVIHVGKDGRYLITTAPNPGDRNTTWEGILQHIPKLRGLEHLFQPKPVTSDEREFYEKYGKKVDLDTYKNFKIKEKYYYIQMNHALSAEQQAITSKELIAVYAKMPERKVKDISPQTLDRLSKGDFNKIFKNDPEKAYEYAKDVLKPLGIIGFPKGEDAIATHAEWSYLYANGVLKNRFPKGEDAIATDPEYSYEYAEYVLKPLGIIGFPKGEDAIATSAKYSYLYAMYVLKNRFPKGEDIIATNAHWSYEYAEYVLKPLGIKGFPKGEDTIATNAEYSYLYARDVLERKFPKGEDAIATNAYYSYWYAKEVLKNRFPKGEDVIRGSRYQKYYEESFGVKL
jgi:lambda repressor-like predicted transcriptional regulator